MTPKQLSAWVAAITPILGLIGYQGYQQVGAVKSQYVTHEQASANHLRISIKQVEAEIKYMDGRDLTAKELIHYKELMTILADLENERARQLGIFLSP